MVTMDITEFKSKLQSKLEQIVERTNINVANVAIDYGGDEGIGYVQLKSPFDFPNEIQLLSLPGGVNFDKFFETVVQTGEYQSYPVNVLFSGRVTPSSVKEHGGELMKNTGYYFECRTKNSLPLYLVMNGLYEL